MTQYKPYAEYKESGVDWMPSIPSHWSTSSIGHQVTFNPRPTLGEKRANPRVTFLPMSAVGTDGSLELTDTRQFSDLDGSYTFFREGDLCFAKVTPCFENGKGAVLTGLSAGMGFGSSELTVVTPKKPEQVNILKYYLVLQPFRQLGTSWMSGTAGLQRVPDLFAKSFPFFAAPLPEQQAIANFLDRETEKIDALIQKKSKFIELLEEKRQALISHAVTKGLNPDAPMKDSGVPWLGEVPEHWEVRQLKHLINSHNGMRVPVRSDERQITNKTYPYYGASGIVDYVDDYIFDFKTLLVSEDGANLVARSTPIAFTADGKYWVNNHAHVLTSDIIPLEYLAYQLNATDLTDFITGAAQPKLTAEALGKIKMALPASNELAEIHTRIKTADHSIRSLSSIVQNSIALLREKRSALITAAVTGQIDVREEVLG